MERVGRAMRRWDFERVVVGGGGMIGAVCFGILLLVVQNSRLFILIVWWPVVAVVDIRNTNGLDGCFTDKRQKLSFSGPNYLELIEILRKLHVPNIHEWMITTLLNKFVV
jgi:hypothetical protein